MTGRYGNMARVSPIPAREVPRQNSNVIAPTTPTVTPLGAELRRLRGRVSQSRLADAVGCDHAYISRLESGTRNPSRAVVLAIIAALELSQADAARLLNLAGYTADGPRCAVADDLAAFLAQPNMDAEFRSACEVVARDMLDQMRAGWLARRKGPS